jgi:hypothetical protein
VEPQRRAQVQQVEAARRRHRRHGRVEAEVQGDVAQQEAVEVCTQLLLCLLQLFGSDRALARPCRRRNGSSVDSDSRRSAL